MSGVGGARSGQCDGVALERTEWHVLEWGWIGMGCRLGDSHSEGDATYYLLLTTYYLLLTTY